MGPLRTVSLPTDEVVWGSTYAEGDERAIRLTILRADTVGTLYEVPNPFVGGFQMAVQADSLLLLGAAAQGTQFFSLLKLAVPVQCGPVPA